MVFNGCCTNTLQFSRQVQEHERIIICLTGHSIAIFHGIRMGGPSPFKQSYFPRSHKEISSNLPHEISHTQPLKEWCLEDDPLLFLAQEIKCQIMRFQENKKWIESEKGQWFSCLLHPFCIVYSIYSKFFRGVQRVDKSWKMFKVTHHYHLLAGENKPTKLAGKILLQKIHGRSRITWPKWIFCCLLYTFSRQKVPAPNEKNVKAHPICKISKERQIIHNGSSIGCL